MRKIFLPLLLCLFPALLVLAGPAAGKTDLEPVVLQLKWKHQFQFAGFYAAVAQGYYRQAGLAVTLKERQPNMPIADELVSGRAQYAIEMPGLLLARQAGKPIVVMAAILQHSPEILVARK